jgi:hypothetical protein
MRPTIVFSARPPIIRHFPPLTRDIMKRFEARQAILEAAMGSLEPRQVRALRMAMVFRPIKTQAAIDTVVLNCQAAHLVNEDGEITEAAADWAAILKQIMEWLPTILKLFGL